MKIFMIVLALAGASLVPGTEDTWTDGVDTWRGSPYCKEEGMLLSPNSPALLPDGSYIGACSGIIQGGVVAQCTIGQGVLTGCYYDGPNFERLVAVRDDAKIDFDWSNGGPEALGGLVDNFSVKWEGDLAIPAGNYTFVMTVDDGGRLYVDAKPVIDAWWQQAPTRYAAQLALAGDVHRIKMEYNEIAQGALAQLAWGLSVAAPTHLGVK